jgi:DNA-binding transcriptional LysR family regulator
MDTRFLDSFITVVDHGSIAEAARRLNLTAAAVAQRIRALESDIGATLVIRSGRAVRPTEAGMAILARARKFVGEVRDLKSIAVSGKPAGELRIGAFATAMTGLMPSIVRSMADQCPQIAPHLVRDNSIHLYPKVLAGNLDAAILVRPPFALPKVCDRRLLREEPQILLRSKSLPLRSVRSILSSEPYIRPDRRDWGAQLAEGYLRRAGIRPHERMELNSLEAIATMVDQGLGVSIVPDWAPPWPEHLSVRKIPLPDARSFVRRIEVIWLRASPRLRLVLAFLEIAVASVGRG